MSQSREDKEISNIDSKQHHMSHPSTPNNNIGGESLTHKSYTKTSDSISVPKAFILNEDMAKIRQAELVILAEERKFGELSRDTFNRIAPKLQAMTSHASLQLKKDNYRPMIEPSVSAPTFAPHALLSDIGLADQAWTPIDIDSKEDIDATGGGGGGNAVTSKSASHNLNANKSDNTLGANFSYSADKDTSLLAITRGAGKSGGTLTPLQAKGAYSRVRKPLKTTLASDMEFKRNRQIRTLNEKIQEINLLRAELELQTLKLHKNISISRSPNASRERGKTTKSLDMSSKSGYLATTTERGGGGIVSEEQKLHVVKLAVSNHTFGEVKDNVKDTSNNASRTLNEDRTSSASPKARRKSMITRTSSPNDNLLKNKSDLVVSNNRDIDSLHNNTKAIKDLNSEVIILQQKADHFKHEESNIYVLKESERSAKNKELSRDIERKRRLLTKEQGVRVGPPPQDDENMYDYYAIRVQKTIRGWLARCWIRWFRMMSIKAAKILQAAMRGWLGRMRVRRIRRNYNAATIIQKNFRGWITRVSSKSINTYYFIMCLKQHILYYSREQVPLWQSRKTFKKLQLQFKEYGEVF